MLYPGVTNVGLLVLIAPLWNWNLMALVAKECLNWVLIAPLWNWNLQNSTLSIQKQLGSNRTFMELKWKTCLHSFLNIRVLIAPLWNWNTVANFGAVILSRSNRTFMELKCPEDFRGCAPSLVLIAPLWNWNPYYRTNRVSIISWLSVLYAINGRKVTMWILCRYEKCEI